MATPDRCCDQMHADGYCPEHNLLGGSYAGIRAEQEANAPRVQVTRRQAQWGRRQGSAGYANRRRG